MNAYLELTFSLQEANTYHIHYRLSDGTSIDSSTPTDGQHPMLFTVDWDKHREYRLNPNKYGRWLGDILFNSPRLREKVAGLWPHYQPLRFFLRFEPGSEPLHQLHWETLRLTDGTWVGQNENIHFARFFSIGTTNAPRPTHPRPRVLLAITHPDNLTAHPVKPLNIAEEKEKALRFLGKLDVDSCLGSEATLDGLRQQLKQKPYSYLYLVCHGRMGKGNQTLLLAEGAVYATHFIQMLQNLDQQNRPQLVVLVSCESAGVHEFTTEPWLALAPRLVQEAKIPAVIAFLGNIRIETAQALIPAFWQEFLVDGRITRALAAARSRNNKHPDWWRVVLFTNLEHGQLELYSRDSQRLTKDDMSQEPVRLAFSGHFSISKAEWSELINESGANFLSEGIEKSSDNPQLADHSMYRTIDGNPMIDPVLPYTLEKEYSLVPNNFFVGRENLIQTLLQAITHIHIAVIVGIPGIGKTSLIKELATHLEQEGVFWYECREGIVFIEDVLLKLTNFLRMRGSGYENLFSRDFLELPLNSQIEFVIRLLNEITCFLCFDSIQYIPDDSPVNSFFKLLTRRLKRGAVFFTSRTKPLFYSPVDTVEKRIVEVELEGLSHDEVALYFSQQNVNLPAPTVQLLQSKFGGLPQALNFVLTLVENDLHSNELTQVLEKAEEELLNYLFQEIYEQLEESERDLLRIGSLFNLPIQESHLIGAGQDAFQLKEAKFTLKQLQKKRLFRCISQNCRHYDIHDTVCALAQKYIPALNQWRIQLANYLEDQIDGHVETLIEAIALYYRAEMFDRAAKLVILSFDETFFRVATGYAKMILDGFHETQLSPTNWLKIIQCKGTLSRFWRRYEEAETYYQQTLQLANVLRDKEAIASAFHSLGTTYLLWKKLSKAEQFYTDGLTLFKEINDWEGQTSAYGGLGEVYVANKNFGQAQIVLEKAIELIEGKDPYTWQELSIYATLAHLHGRQGKCDEAIRCTRKAYTIAEQFNAHYQMGTLIYDLGVHESIRDDVKQSREYYLQALEVAQEWKFWELEELTLLALGLQNHTAADYDGAIACFQRVKNIQEQTGDVAKLVVTLFDLGTFYWRKENYERAVACYEQGLKLFSELQDESLIDSFLNNVYGLAQATAEPRRIINTLKYLKNSLLSQGPSYKSAKVYHTIGAIYLVMKKYRVAVACFCQEIAFFSQMNLVKEQIMALAHLGAVYDEVMEQHGVAVTTFSTAIEIASNHNLGNQNEVAITLYNRGNCLTRLELWEQAKKDYEAALTIAEAVHNEHLQNDIRHNLAEVFRRSGNSERAVDLVQNCISFAQRNNDIDAEIYSLNNLGLVYQLLEKEPEAFYYFQMALELSQSHFRRSAESQIYISLGNLYLESSRFENAINCFTQALAAARAAENMEWEEASVISLGHTHKRLGTFDAIEDEVKAIANRAVTLRRYKSLVDFSLLAGDVNLQSESLAIATQNFTDALILGLILDSKRVAQFLDHKQQPELFIEMQKVWRHLRYSLYEAVQRGQKEFAWTLYQNLMDNMRSSYGSNGLLVIRWLELLQEDFKQLSGEKSISPPSVSPTNGKILQLRLF